MIPRRLVGPPNTRCQHNNQPSTPIKLHPKLSAYAGIHGADLDFAKHLIHPPGQLVVVHAACSGARTP